MTFTTSQNLQAWNIQTNQVYNKLQMCRLIKPQVENLSQPRVPSVAICTEMYLYVYGECVFSNAFPLSWTFLTILFSLAYAKSWLQANNVDTDVENLFIF